MIYQMGDILNGVIDIQAELSKEGILLKQEKAKQPSNKANNYVNRLCAFDIETSRIDLPIPKGEKQNSHSFMYVWQFQIGPEHTIMGRTWDEFIKLIDLICVSLYNISEVYHLKDIPHVVVWVHNLSYEWQWLSDLYHFKHDECFFRDVRKPIYCSMYGCIEFRCSYLQTNMSLEVLTKQYKVDVKLSGQKYDYEKIRFPWTELTDYEKEYCIRDVSSLVAVMYKRMEMDGDTLQTIPLTSTGYVRRDVREALKPLYLQIRDILPTEKAYRLLRDAFRGGNTHCNKKFSGRVLGDGYTDERVYSYDMASCYPAMQLTKKYPMGKWRFLDDRLNLDRILHFVGLGYAVVGRYAFTNLRLKNKNESIPYLSLSRTESEQFKVDNGRILYAKICSCALTEIDLDIVIKQYDYDEIIVTSAMVSQKDYLPEEYKNVIRRYYHNKTALKGIKNDPVAEYLYRKDKEKLNAIFGMSCQSALNSDVLFIDDTFVVLDYETRKKSEIEKILNKLQEKGIDDKSLVKALEKASDIDKTLLKAKYPYSWGCYTTAYARAALQEGIDLAGDKMVYCDTDSIKTLGPVDIEKINESRRNLAKRFGGVEKDRNGISHYIGIFEYEMTYTNFVSTGAKRYAYIEGSCPLSESCTTWPRCAMGITVSGVQSKKINEETGLPFAVEELGSLENFREDFTWYKAGGVLAVYNDFDNFDYTDPETGRSVHIGKNVALCPSTYKMTYEKNYKDLLTELKLYGEYIDERK